MKIPRVPEKPDNPFYLPGTTDQMPILLETLRDLLAQDKYFHWEKLRYYPIPAGITHELLWAYLKVNRQPHYKYVPLYDKEGENFKYILPDPIPERLHQIDSGAAGRIEMNTPFITSETKDRYYISSLIEESITSSQIEGAITTRQVAKEMIKNSRDPRDRSERMILNNYLTMKKINEIKDRPLSKELIFEIHRLMTDKTLEDLTGAGRFRLTHEAIYVGDQDDDAKLHVPPVADELEDRMAAMCAFANGETPDFFIHPVIRSIILHFWLAYDHPFVDGNGRTARALFYWSMLHYGFWLCEFISISKIILKGRVKYGEAFLYTETDDNDLTYFILYHIDVIKRAIEELHEYIQRKTAEYREIEAELKGMASLNYRQRELMNHALKHPDFRYTIKSHMTSHGVVHQTARTDLHELVEMKLLQPQKLKKVWYFTPSPDLEDRLRNLS